MICVLVLLLILLIYLLLRPKEKYKRQRRHGIRGGWKRKGKSGVTVAKTGTRYPQWEKRDEDFIEE